MVPLVIAAHNVRVRKSRLLIRALAFLSLDSQTLAEAGDRPHFKDKTIRRGWWPLSIPGL